MFFMSATSESMWLRYSSGSGSGHSDSPARFAALWQLDPAGLVVAQQAGDAGAEGHDRGSGQRGEVDDGVGLLLGGQREGVGEHQPALGVGVEHLDRLAVPGGAAHHPA